MKKCSVLDVVNAKETAIDRSGRRGRTIKGYDASNWYAIATASGTPRGIVLKLHDEIARYFTSPEMQRQMTAMGAVIDIKTPDEMRKIIPVEIAKWTGVAIDAGMPREK